MLIDVLLAAEIAADAASAPVSLQAGDDLILKRMKRRHLRSDAIRFCDTVRAARPDIVLGADLIAGFPTESEAAFENTLRLVGECGLTWLHVFPFSPRPGTPAARMPQLPRATVRERAARLRALGAERAAAHLAGRWAGRAASWSRPPRPAAPRAMPRCDSPGRSSRAGSSPP
ncbi:MAG: hypothetical protein KatS3mg118_3494 [Paracoccaceae bacterium]|nr:MAG: hypothetical protein KatS3mg118_3494 [Paracoccaceae bacterium]